MAGDTGYALVEIIASGLALWVLNIARDVAEQTVSIGVMVGLLFELFVVVGLGVPAFLPFAVLIHMAATAFFGGGRCCVLVGGFGEMAKTTGPKKSAKYEEDECAHKLKYIIPFFPERQGKSIIVARSSSLQM